MTNETREKIKKFLFAEICDVVKDCEATKEVVGSEYGREQAEVSAYKEIRKILGITNEGD